MIDTSTMMNEHHELADGDTPLKSLTISPEQITEWESELERLERKIADHNEAAAALRKKIAAARLLLGEPEPETVRTISFDRSGKSVAALILECLHQESGSLGLKDLRDRVETAQGTEWLAGQVNYFYTAIERLRKDGLVGRDPKTKVVSLTVKGREKAGE